jgi:hypothetical protein
MMGDFDTDAIPRMLKDARTEVAYCLGRERIICGPGNLREALGRIEVAMLAAIVDDARCRIALLLDDEDERRMIATAIVEQAQGRGLPAILTRDSWGRWAHEAKTSRRDPRTLHVLTSAPPEAKAREGFAAISGSLILLLPLQFAGSALLPERTEDIILTPFSERPLDKAAHVIDSTWTALETTEDAAEQAAAVSLFHRLDASALLGTFIDTTKLANVAAAKDAGKRLAAALLRQSALRVGEPLRTCITLSVRSPYDCPQT